MAAILNFVSVDFLTNACVSTGQIFWLLIRDDQLRHLSKMAATAAIFLTNALVNWSDFLVAHWGDWRNVPIDNQRRRTLPFLIFYFFVKSSI
jgi:hypothetical protein